MLEFLPKKIEEGLRYLNYNYLYEIRIRSDFPVIINYRGNYTFLSSHGICREGEKAVRIRASELEELVFAAGNYSLYACSEQMKEGFITSKEGVRIGLAGQVATEGGKILSVRDISSVCIRIPHAVDGCADKIYSVCLADKFRNVLLLSPPGFGKTTILRALIEKITIEHPFVNITVADERGEIFPECFSCNADVIRFLHKNKAIEIGIRTLRPDIIVADEVQPDEWKSLLQAKNAGVKIIATCHAEESVQNGKGIFERFVYLGNSIGNIRYIYDEEQNLL